MPLITELWKTGRDKYWINVEDRASGVVLYCHRISKERYVALLNAGMIANKDLYADPIELT